MTAIEQHRKCIAVLEMIATCDLMLETATHYFHITPHRKIPEVEQGYKDDLRRYTAIKQRLLTYHHNLIKKIA